MNINSLLKDVCWQKQGPTPSKEKEDKMPTFTEEELCYISAAQNVPMVMLAATIIKQWTMEGRPAKDYPSIKLWVEVIHEAFGSKNG